MATMAAKKKTTKKAPARATPKVSPLKGMSVDAWVKAKTAGWQREVIGKLLALAKRAAPGATVSIKWAQPVFEQNGPFAFIKPAKAHVTFGFWRGAELTDGAGVLEGGDRMKHVKIASAEALDEKRLAAFVREAVALNAAKGDPTKR
jgi:hypothetical protein